MTEYFETMVNILDDEARIYYHDDEMTLCAGWQIVEEDGTLHAFHPCDDADKAFRKLSRMGFIF